MATSLPPLPEGATELAPPEGATEVPAAELPPLPAGATEFNPEEKKEEEQPKPQRPKTIADTMGWTNPWLRAGSDFVAGVGAGGANTVRNINKAVNWAIPSVPVAVPESETRAPDTLAGKAGKFAEQGAEFLLPAA